MKWYYKLASVLLLLFVLLVPGVAIASAATVTSYSIQATDTFRMGYNGSTWSSTTAYLSVGYSTNTYYRMRTGIRFNNVTVPRGATIISAKIKLTAYPATTSSVMVNSLLQGEAADNAQTFSDTNNFSTRNKTASSVYWDSIPVWTAESVYTTPDISPIIRDITGRSAWVSGNSLVIFWGDDGDRTAHTNASYRIAYSYEASSSKAPVLSVEYTVPATPTATPTPSSTPVATITTADIANQITNLNNQIVLLQSQVAGVQNMVSGSSNLEKVLSGVTTSVAQITQTSNTINSGVTNLANKVAAMSENQNKLQADLNNTSTNIKKLGEEIDGLRGKVTTLTIINVTGVLIILAVIGALAIIAKKKIL